ncbi:MAG: XrtA/PEP-CTERM system TPR-repeat protein PrsT [Halioglobus sp.]
MINAIRTISLTAIMTMLAACGTDMSQEERIAIAQQFIANSEYKSAIIELKNVIQEDNQSAEARWLLGEIYLKSGDVLSAEKELKRALELGWPQNDVVPALAEIWLAQGKYTDVNALEETGLQPQAEASLLASKALAAMALGKNQKARKLADKALDKAPESPSALLAKARILTSQGDFDGADALLTDLLALNPEHAAAWSLLGDIRMGQRQLDEAMSAYDKAISFQKNNFGTLFKRALLSLQQENYDAAQTDASALLRISPQHPGANYVQGLVHFQAAKYGDAITSLSVAEPAFKQFPLVLFFLGSAQLVEGHLDQAAVQAVHFHTIAPESIRGRKLLATIRLPEGKYGEVQELLQPVLEDNPDDVGSLNLMSNALLRDGKIDEGITLLSRVAELQPDSPVAQVRLGAGLLMGGESEDAARHMEAALALDPEFQQADILLVLNHLQKQDYTAAIEAAQAYRRRNLTSTTPLNLLGRVYLAAGQEDKAVESFEKALTFDAGDPAANNNLAQMALAREDLAAARQYYETTLEHHQDYLPALIQLALLDAKEDKGQSLVDRLEQAINVHPEAIEPRLLLGRYYLSQDRPEKVAPLFASLNEVQKQSQAVLQLIALAQLSGKEHGEALYTLEQLNESAPENAPVHHMLAMAASGTGDAARAEQELRRALEIDENYLPSRIALARLTLINGNSGEFDQHLAILTSQAPENPDVLLLRAASANQRGDNTEAVKLAEQAFTLAPGTATLLALGSQREAAGDRESAIALYRTWINENPKDVTVKMVAANSLQAAQKEDEAQVYYAQVIELDPDNVIALNNQAWLTREQNPTQALEYVRHANSLAPDSAEILDTLAVVEFANKNYKQAQRSIERALLQGPDNPSLLYHSAMISAALGDTASAITILEDLLGDGPEFPEIGEARKLLGEIEADVPVDE